MPKTPESGKPEKKMGKGDRHFLGSSDSTGSYQSVPGTKSLRHSDRRGRQETHESISRNLEPGEGNMNHPSILRLYDNTLDPNHSFWLRIGLSQDSLVTMLGRGRILKGFTFSQLTTELDKIPVIED